MDSLTKSFLTIWQTNNYQLPLVFKAPTGAGKTIMMAEFLRTLDGNYHFDDDKAYIWISFGGDDSYLQSKEKLYKYFNNGTDMTLRDKNDLSLKELPKNLDSTDGLAAAVCHFFNSGRVEVGKSYSGWDAFVKQNEDRIKK